MGLLLLFFSVFASSVVGFHCYFYLAKKFQVQAIPNHRSLHAGAVPRGAGVVIAMVVLLGVSGLYWQQYLALPAFLIFGLGGVIGAAVGFADDVLDVKAVVRLFFQIGLALIILIYQKLYPDFSQPIYLIFAKLCGSAVLIFCMVWFFNAFNFIDGSDGMAISSVVYIVSVVATILLFKHAYAESIFFGILLLPSVVFLFFNWPPAKAFLGDAGSFFLGYSLCFLLFDTVLKGLISVWVWLILFAYYFADTTLTNFVRFLTVPYWYRPHRSHAYQNLARNWGHLKVLKMVLMIDILWLLPLTLFAFAFPHYTYIFLFFAYAPLCVFVLKHGPLHENK